MTAADRELVRGPRPRHVWVVDAELPKDNIPDATTIRVWLARQRELPPEKRGAFYWPTNNRLYRSRSSAVERADLFRSYGVEATVVRLRCEVDPPAVTE